MNPVIKIGNKRTLTEADMPGLAKRDQAVHVQDLVEVRREGREGGRVGRRRLESREQQE